MWHQYSIEITFDLWNTTPCSNRLNKERLCLKTKTYLHHEFYLLVSSLYKHLCIVKWISEEPKKRDHQLEDSYYLEQYYSMSAHWIWDTQLCEVISDSASEGLVMIDWKGKSGMVINSKQTNPLITSPYTTNIAAMRTNKISRATHKKKGVDMQSPLVHKSISVIWSSSLWSVQVIEKQFHYYISTTKQKIIVSFLENQGWS